VMDGGAEKALIPLAEFERFLEEEASLAEEFDLSLALIVVSREAGWNEDSTRRALGILRLADLAALLSPNHLVAFLPNTGFEGARAVERRMTDTLPDAAFGMTLRRPGEGGSEFLRRAREDF
ncbi:MAG: hypothetical protein ACRDSJ_05105, partial [Rubrobacteraceae bacterium]